MALYQDRKYDQRGQEILAELAPRLTGTSPNTPDGWTKYLKQNLKLIKELAPRIENPILRKALQDLYKYSEEFLKKIQSGQGTKKDTAAYRSKSNKTLKEALEQYKSGGK